MESHQPLLDALAGRHPSSDYTRGAHDLLHLLGLLDERGQPSGEVSALLLDSLRAHLMDGVSAGLNWDDLDGEGLRGVDLLRAIESSRAARLANPTPARIVRVAQAVIKSSRGGDDAYLMQYDRRAGQYQPLGGKVDATDADAAAALRREIGEELGLSRAPTSGECPLTLLRAEWGTTRLSATYGILTRYAFDFFHVERLAVPIPLDADTRWLPRRDLSAGTADDGRPISEVLAAGLGWATLDSLSPTISHTP